MKKKLYSFPLGALTTLIFFLIGFLTHQWQYAWLVFLANPIFYWIIRSIPEKKKEEVKNVEKASGDSWGDF